jgi:hypothetical protein
VIELVLPMPVRRILANDQVGADRGRVALERGPLVYCAEWPDNPQGHVRNLLLPDNAKLTSEFKPDLLNGVTIIKGKAFGLAYDAQGKVVRTEQDFTAIPYYAWATTSQVTVSGRNRRDPRMINDGEEPSSSSDPTSYFDWWPKKGSTEWVEYAFTRPATVSGVEVYWFDDTGRGEVRVPASWRVLYQDGGEWRPVENHEPYGAERDRYNKVSFKPVTTTGLRLEVTMQQNWSAGIQEWRVK